MSFYRCLPVVAFSLIAASTCALAQTASSPMAPTQPAQAQSNEKLPQPPRIEQSYPLANEQDREKTTKLMQQLVVDLLGTFSNYKEVHWNLNGPLYLTLHEFYQYQADYYRKQADIFAERSLHMGYSIDGRYSTIAKTTTLPDIPAGYVTDNDSLKLQLDRVKILDKEVYSDIDALSKSDPVPANQLQTLAYDIDKNLWQLRIFIQKPGGSGPGPSLGRTTEPRRNEVAPACSHLQAIGG